MILSAEDDCLTIVVFCRKQTHLVITIIVTFITLAPAQFKYIRGQIN